MFVLHDVAEEEEKVFHLCHHAKKLVTRFDKFNFLAQLLIKPFK
jgi:siroheme synthase (precorrin-2 oxidase/ferrochelatase)